MATYSVPLKTIVAEQGLTILHACSDYDTQMLTTRSMRLSGLTAPTP